MTADMLQEELDTLKKERALLQKKLEFFENVFNKIPGNIYMLDIDGKVIWCNKTMAEIAAQSSDELTGKIIHQIIPSDNAAGVLMCNQRVIEENKPTTFKEYGINAEGNEITYYSRKIPIAEPDGTIHGILGVSIDVSENETNEYAFYQEREKARIKMTDDYHKTNFLAIMSHELRTPLNAILGASQLLAKAQAYQNDANQYIDVIANSSQNLLNIINDVLDFSKLESGKFSLSYESFDLHQLLSNLETTTHQLIDKSNIQFSVNMPNIPHYIYSSRQGLQQVLLNMLGNAAKFTSTGQICLTVEQETLGGKHQLHFKISDTGIGIPDDMRDVIFDNFTQYQSRYTRTAKGTGLGLAISKQIINKMNGKITLESQLGVGSTFTITIPFKLTHAEHPQPIETNNSYDSPLLKNTKILLVEDNHINQLIAKQMLLELDCHVTIAADGKEVFQYLDTKNTFDIILMDLGLPDKNGLEITEEIRHKYPQYSNTPILAMTAHTLPEDQAKCYQAGMNDIITKPVIRKNLHNTLRQYVDTLTELN